MKSRDKLLREETYRKGAMMVRQGKLPTLYHTTEEFKIISCEIQKAGAVVRDGKRLEYQVLKIFLEEKVSAPNTNTNGIELEVFVDSATSVSHSTRELAEELQRVYKLVDYWYAEAERMRSVLSWMDTIGGLGLEVHERIKQALMSAVLSD